MYKIPQSKTKPKDENVRISSVHYCARGSHLEGHLWVILKFAQNVTSSNQNHHYRPKTTIKDYFECCVTMGLELCAVKKLYAADVEKLIIWNNPCVENQTLPHYTSPTGLLH